MKKIISVLIAAAMCLTLSVGAFAAQSDVDNLKNLVNNARGLSSSQKAQACAFLDDYSAEHADAISAGRCMTRGPSRVEPSCSVSTRACL